MNWTLVMVGFALAVLMGAGFVALLATLRPQWSARRRQIFAASVLPVITAVATILAILFIATSDHDVDETMQDLAISALLTIGGGFTIIALVGGLVGSTLAGRRHR